MQSASLVPEELHGSQTRARNNEGIWDVSAHEDVANDRNLKHVEMEEDNCLEGDHVMSVSTRESQLRLECILRAGTAS